MCIFEMEGKTMLFYFLISSLLNGVWAKCNLSFPEYFKFGAATSSYQIEGAWNASDKTPSIWDVYIHNNPDTVEDHSNGDIACDSYNKWQDDINIATDLGLDFYRFSISWPRVLPNGTPEYISKDGVRYYNNLINGLLKRGIEPVVTIYHWELPQRFDNLGGWVNPLIATWLGNYARVLFTSFGDRVKTWITVNQPLVVCTVAYTVNITPPNFEDYDIGCFQCMKNLMMAHATVYRIYEKEFKHKYRGRVGLSNYLINMVPASKEDEELTELATQYINGIYSHPIFSKSGGWPSNIEKAIKKNSITKGWQDSRLPSFTMLEQEFVQGTADFYGLNFYTSKIVTKAKKDEILVQNIFKNILEIQALLNTDPSWKKAAPKYLYQHPEGLRDILSWVKRSYGNIEIMIFENGYASAEYNLHDVDRINYMKVHLENILLAIHKDGINVTRYTTWSLMDVFEWTTGFSNKFGLYETNFTSPLLTRTARDSAHYYKNVIRTRNSC